MHIHAIKRTRRSTYVWRTDFQHMYGTVLKSLSWDSKMKKILTGGLADRNDSLKWSRNVNVMLILRHEAPLVVVFSCLHGEKTRYYLDDYCGNLNWIWNSPCTSHTFLFHPNSGRVESSLMMVFPQQISEWDLWKTDFPFKYVSEHKELYNSIPVYTHL